MALDLKPSTGIGLGYTSDDGSHTITFNTADASSDIGLPELTDDEADPDTGDVRKLFFAISHGQAEAWRRIPAEDRPKNMSIMRSSQSTGNKITHTFTFVFVNDIIQQEVADEPA